MEKTFFTELLPRWICRHITKVVWGLEPYLLRRCPIKVTWKSENNGYSRRVDLGDEVGVSNRGTVDLCRIVEGRTTVTVVTKNVSHCVNARRVVYGVSIKSKEVNSEKMDRQRLGFTSTDGFNEPLWNMVEVIIKRIRQTKRQMDGWIDG